MMMGGRCEACAAWMCMPRKRSRRPAAREEPDLSLIVHPITKVLSQKRSAWIFDKLDVRHYSAIHLITSPAISR